MKRGIEVALFLLLIAAVAFLGGRVTAPSVPPVSADEDKDGDDDDDHKDGGGAAAHAHGMRELPQPHSVAVQFDWGKQQATEALAGVKGWDIDVVAEDPYLRLTLADGSFHYFNMKTIAHIRAKPEGAGGAPPPTTRPGGGAPPGGGPPK